MIGASAYTYYIWRVASRIWEKMSSAVATLTCIGRENRIACHIRLRQPWISGPGTWLILKTVRWMLRVGTTLLWMHRNESTFRCLVQKKNATNPLLARASTSALWTLCMSRALHLLQHHSHPGIYFRELPLRSTAVLPYSSSRCRMNFGFSYRSKFRLQECYQVSRRFFQFVLFSFFEGLAEFGFLRKVCHFLFQTGPAFRRARCRFLVVSVVTLACYAPVHFGIERCTVVRSKYSGLSFVGIIPVRFARVDRDIKVDFFTVWDYILL